MASMGTRKRATARIPRRWAAPLSAGVLDEMWLRRLVGATTVAAARSCAQEGDLLQHEWDPGGARVVGIVRGQDGSTLQATAEVIRSQDGRTVCRFDGRCACPIARNCFHSFALQFELVPDPKPAGRATAIRRAGPHIRLRPVRRSPAGNWVRTGIDWSNLDYLGWDVRSQQAERFDEQLALLRELSALS